MNAKTRWLPFLTACAAVMSAGLISPVLAGDADGQRDISPYDANPACLERGQVQPGQPNPCELPAPASARFPIVRAPAASSAGNSTNGVVQGAQAGQRIGSAVSGGSVNAGQGSGGTGTSASTLGVRGR